MYINGMELNFDGADHSYYKVHLRNTKFFNFANITIKLRRHEMSDEEVFSSWPKKLLNYEHFKKMLFD